MTSAARFPYLSILAAAARARSRLGGSCDSHSMQLLALVMAAAMGCLISCASDAALSPNVLTRLVCARSASSCRSLSLSCSALLSSVMSVELPTNCSKSPAPERTGWPTVWIHSFSPTFAAGPRGPPTIQPACASVSKIKDPLERALGLIRPRVCSHIKCGPDPSEQQVMIERLCEELDCTLSHRSNSNPGISMSRDEDGRNIAFLFFKPGLQLQT